MAQHTPSGSSKLAAGALKTQQLCFARTRTRNARMLPISLSIRTCSTRLIFLHSFNIVCKLPITVSGQIAKSNKDSVRDALTADLWRCIVLKLDIDSLLQLRKVNTSFRELVQNFMLETWRKWNAWKNQVPLYPPEVSGYSTAAKSVDKLLFESLVCMNGPQKLQLGSFEREGRRCNFLHNNFLCSDNMLTPLEQVRKNQDMSLLAGCKTSCWVLISTYSAENRPFVEDASDTALLDIEEVAAPKLTRLYLMQIRALEDCSYESDIYRNREPLSQGGLSIQGHYSKSARGLQFWQTCFQSTTRASSCFGRCVSHLSRLWANERCSRQLLPQSNVLQRVLWGEVTSTSKLGGHLASTLSCLFSHCILNHSFCLVVSAWCIWLQQFPFAFKCTSQSPTYPWLM